MSAATQLAGGLLALDPVAQDLLFRQARTANAFTAEPVSEAQVRAIHDLVSAGPTAYNSQPLRIVLVRSAAGRQRLLPYLSRGNRDKTAAAPLVAILAADAGFHELLPEVFPHRPEARDWFVGDYAGRVDQARFNATLQAGYFLLGVRAAGLAAGPMAGFDAAGVDRDFFAGTGYRSLLVVNIGRPAADAWRPDRLPRLAYDRVVHTV